MMPDARSAANSAPAPHRAPELTPEEWAPLKAVWERCATPTDPDAVSRLDTGDLSPAALRVLQDLLALDSTVGERFERPAHERLGLMSAGNAEDLTLPTMVGRRLGPYRVLDLVGRGGMGAVYEAERADLVYRQRVAIKTLWRGADSAVLLQRFRSERQILAALQHPNIAQLLDGGSTDEGTPWLAMEFVEGTPIDEWCDARTLDIPARLDLFRDVCAAVQHAHQRLVVHRDLKPSNILVSPEGVVKLLDFGVAKLIAPNDEVSTLTNAGLSPLTAAYAAPEQLDEVPPSTATDIFALGAILTCLLAGEPPRDVAGLSAADRLLAIRERPLRQPSAIAALASMPRVSARRYSARGKLAAALRGDLDAIAGKALHREPARRYASAEALSDDVRRYLRRERVLARPDSTGYRVWSFVRRQRVLTTAVLGVLASVTVSGGVAWRQARVAKAEALRAERAAAFLSGLVTGTDATSYDPLVRLAPNGTVSQLLDSALSRIPRELSDDDRTRARLYTAIGASLVGQGRPLSALAVLDSAQRLAVQAYGITSIAFARARLEHAAVQLDLGGPAATTGALREVEAVAAAHPSDRELAARIALFRSSRAMQLGRVREADSLALAVLSSERGGARSILSLRAEAMRLYASSWIRRDPRDYLRRARAVQALADSLDLDVTNETTSARNAEFESLLVLGRADEARAVLPRLRASMGTRSDTTAVNRAWTGYQRIYLATVLSDTMSRRVAAKELHTLLRSDPPLGITLWLLATGAIVNEALTRKDTAAALDVARRAVARVVPTASPLFATFAMWHLAQAETAAGNPARALAAVAEGQRWLAEAPDLASMQPVLGEVELKALVALGRTVQAEQVRARLPKPGSIPPCTAGGSWKGCPDQLP
ncbi:serine/threonine protein kinase [Gemmatimonas sp. UBA7669]|uniref:serine/threonine protein kinase n=1 Tax=Gemmatimonas sp. UBA7669 TaxID=1946568 RepID=UPI0025C167A5|nr:serine/threonine-protein kinase [Gemmatimonas sp. UBA7669]